MPAINLNLSDDEQKKAKLRASELGFSSLESYLHSLISADVDAPLSDELEAELLKALDKPGREMSPGDWQEKRRRLVEKHRQAKAG
jgi:hypothetical protein